MMVNGDTVINHSNFEAALKKIDKPSGRKGGE